MTEATLEQTTEEVRRRMQDLGAIGGTVVLDFGESHIFIDGRDEAPAVSNEDGDADCRIRLAHELMASIMAGERSGFTAFMSGKISAQGDMSVAVKLRGLLSGR